MKKDGLSLYISAVLLAAAFMAGAVTAKITSEREMSVEITDGHAVTGSAVIPVDTAAADNAVIERSIPADIFISEPDTETASSVISDDEGTVHSSAEASGDTKGAFKTATEAETIVSESTVSEAPVSEMITDTEQTAALGTEDTAKAETQTASAEKQAVYPININTADARTLCELPGIGEKTAAAIIEYRTIAPFETIEEIMEVKGIGEKKYEKIKDLITV